MLGYVVVKAEVPLHEHFHLRVWNDVSLVYFEEAVEDDDEFTDTSGDSSAILRTLATDFRMEALAVEHSL